MVSHELTITGFVTNGKKKKKSKMGSLYWKKKSRAGREGRC